MLQELLVSTWDYPFTAIEGETNTTRIESGDILYLPQLPFVLKSTEKSLLSPAVLDKQAKNVSFNPMTGRLKGSSRKANQSLLTCLMERFSATSQQFLENLLPHYRGSLLVGRTSFRPVEVLGRESSPLKDDTRIHIDAFSATPNQGKRILRVFCNINPNGMSRLWQVGEPFQKVVDQFSSLLRPPLFGSRKLLALLKMTKSYRSLYDHYMLMLHDEMKMNHSYQGLVKKTNVHFAAGSTWVVMTDSVSHAALTGQYMLEQTFYLPPEKMQDPKKSPLFILEEALKEKLV